MRIKTTCLVNKPFWSFKSKQYTSQIMFQYRSMSCHQKKGKPGASKALTMHRVQERIQPKGSIIHSLTLHFCHRWFPRLEPVTPLVTFCIIIKRTILYSNIHKCCVIKKEKNYVLNKIIRITCPKKLLMK